MKKMLLTTLLLGFLSACPSEHVHDEHCLGYVAPPIIEKLLPIRLKDVNGIATLAVEKVTIDGKECIIAYRWRQFGITCDWEGQKNEQH